jgi:hypothetical protein
MILALLKLYYIVQCKISVKQDQNVMIYLSLTQ